MTKHAANERVVETLIGAAIIGRQEISSEITAEEVANYFAKAHTPNPEVDEILSHTPIDVSALLAREQLQTTNVRNSAVQLSVVMAMNRNNAFDEHSEQTKSAIDAARSAALKRLQDPKTPDSTEEHAD
jgi:RNA 3'-terminal phosphate cyclase